MGPCQNIKGSKEWLKLFCMSSGHDLTTIKPKTTNFYLSRNSRSNSAGSLLPPKCFQPKSSKSPCIRLGNKKCQKKCLKMNQQEGRILQNIKTDHLRQLFNQPKSSGALPKK